MPRATTNARAFEMLGMTQGDYEAWCDKHGKPKSERSSKKEFFRLALEYRIIKRNGIICETEGDR